MIIVAQEFFDYGSLKIYINQLENFTEPDALFLFKNICFGVKEMHDLGLAHGNLNFNNILIANDQLKLSTLAKTTLDEYKAPETLQSNIIDQKSDIWALGVLLHYLIYGISPYQGNKKEILEKIAVGKKDVKKYQTSNLQIIVSKECTFLLDKMLQKNPDDRPTIQQILQVSLINNVKMEMQNRLISQIKLPDQLKNKYVMYNQTRKKVSYDQYQTEEVYLAFSGTLKQAVNIKVIDYTNQRVIQKHIDKISAFRNLKEKNLQNVFDVELSKNQAFVVVSYSNQSNLGDYLALKQISQRKLLNEKEADEIIVQIQPTLEKLDQAICYHGSIHLQNLFLHKGEMQIGVPLLFNDKAERQLKENKQELDYFAPEFKSDALNMSSGINYSKIDIWSYGMLFYHLIFGEKPIFDQNKKPLFPQSNQISSRNVELITKCLEINPDRRCQWNEIQKENILPLNFKEKKIDTQVIEKNALSQASKSHSSNFNRVQLNNNNMGLIGADEDQLITPMKIMDQSQVQQNQNVILDNGKLKYPTDQNQRLQNLMQDSNLPFITNQQRQINQEVPQDKIILENNQDQSQFDQNLDPNFTNNNLEESRLQMLDDEARLKARKQKELLMQQHQEQLEDMEYVKFKLGNYVGQDEDVEIVHSKFSGGLKMKILYITIKVTIILILFGFVFFRPFIYSSIFLIFKRGFYQKIQYTVRVVNTDGTTYDEDISFLTLNQDYYLNSLGLTLQQFVEKYHCFSDQFDSNYPNRSVLSFLQSNTFIWWTILGILSLLLILGLKIYQNIKLDIYTIYKNQTCEEIGPSRKYLIPLYIMNHLEFAFIYYCHFQIFSFFYYSNMHPCFGLSKFNGVSMMFETTHLVMTGQNNAFLRHIFFTLILFFLIHMVATIFYIVWPLANCKFFWHPIHVIFRMISYIFGIWVVCRIGTFKPYYPTYVYDHNQILKQIFIEGNFQGVIGILPEIFEIFLVVAEFGIGFLFRNTQIQQWLLSALQENYSSGQSTSKSQSIPQVNINQTDKKLQVMPKSQQDNENCKRIRRLYNKQI